MESQIADEFDKTLTLEVLDDEEDDDVDESCSSDSEFSFSGAGDRSSPVPADEIFHNGQIRPIFPFNSDEEATTSYGPPLRKLFVASSPERDVDVAEWSPEKVTAPVMSRKSNSTGFSKLWRFRDLLVRSNSDGKDAFVFLTGKGDETSEISPEKKREKTLKAKAAKTESETATVREREKKVKGKRKKEKSAYEVFYGGRREKNAGQKGKSYLPYKQDLVGFFTNVNGMSRNVHPY